MTNAPSKTAAFIPFAAAVAMLVVSQSSAAAPSNSGEPASGAYSSLIPANRFGMNEGGVGDVSEQFYACVAKEYGAQFRASMARLQRKGRSPTYDSVLRAMTASRS